MNGEAAFDWNRALLFAALTPLETASQLDAFVQESVRPKPASQPPPNRSQAATPTASLQAVLVGLAVPLLSGW